MSTQGIQIPRSRSGGSRRVAVAALVVGALAAGAVAGRATAPAAEVREIVRSATALSDLGPPSIGDQKRAQMFAAMNGLHG